MKNKKTIVAVLTMILVAFGSINVMAKTVATIGSTRYSSLQKAADAVKSRQTIKLVSDIRLKSDIKFQNNVKYTLNLNRHKIHTKDWDSVYFEAGNVTIKNGTVYAPIRIRGKAKVTVISGTYKRRKGDSGNSLFDNSGTLTIKGGSFNGCSSSTGKRARLDISGGTFSCTETAADPLRIAGGKATISGGTFKDSISNGGKTTISGGTYRGISNTGTLTIQYAKVKGTLINTGGKMIIQNGTFHYDGVEHGADTKSSDHTTIIIFSGTVKILGGKITNKYNSVITLFYKDVNVWGSNLVDETKLIIRGGSIKTTSINEAPISMSKNIKDLVTLKLDYSAFPGVAAENVVEYF